MFLYKLPDYEGGFVTKSIECNCIVTRDANGHLLDSKPVNCVKKGVKTNFGKVVDYSKNFVILKKGTELKRVKREVLNNILLKSLEQPEITLEKIKVSGKFNTLAGKVLVKSESEIVRDVLTDPDKVLSKGKSVIFSKTINGKEVEAKVEKTSMFMNTFLHKSITVKESVAAKRILIKGIATTLRAPKVFNIQSAVGSRQSTMGGTAWNAKGGMKPNHKYIERKPAKSGDGYIYLYELPSGKKEWRDEAGKAVEGGQTSADYQLEDFKVGDIVRQDNKLGRIMEASTNMLAVNFGGEMKVINKKEHVEKVKQHQLMKEGATMQYEGNDAKILRITGKAALINTADNKLKVINLEKQLEKYEPKKEEKRLNKYSDVYQGEAERRIGSGGADNYNISYEEQPKYKNFVDAAKKTGFGRKNDLEMVKRVETENGLRTVRWNYNPEDQNISFMVDGKEDYTMNFMGKKYKIRDITEDGYSLEDAETKERGLFLSHKDYNNDLKQQRDEERKNVVVERTGGVNGFETVKEPARTFRFKPEYSDEEKERFEKRGGRRPSRWTRRKDEPLQSEEEKKRLTELQDERDKKNKEVLGTKDFADFEKLHKERGFTIGANRFHAAKEIEAGGRTFRIKSEFKPEKMSWQTSIDGPVKKLQLGEKHLPITDISKDKVFYHEGGDEKSITFDELKTINGKSLFEPTKESKGIVSNLDPVKIYFDDKDVTSGTYEIVEANEIIASHKTDGTPNRDYTISDAQNRDRSTPQSIAQINKIAANPNFDFLSDSKTAQDGAPIVDEDYNVIAGNGRGIGVQLHYSNKGEKYRNDLLKKVEKYGFSRDDVEKMKQPILVRRTNVDAKEAQRLGAISNTSQMLATEEREAAKGKATRIDDATINNLADMFTKGNHESLNQYLDEIGPDVVGELLKKKIIPENEAHLYIDPKSGKMDAGHKEKVKQILTQSVLGESSKHFEKIPEAARAGTVKSLGDIFALKGKAGDLVPHLQEAIKVLAKYEAVKNNFKSPDDFVKQAANDAFEPLKGSKEGLALFDLLADPIREVTKENGKKEKKNVISDFIRKYKLSLEGDMFGEGKPAKEAFDEVFKPRYEKGVNKSLFSRLRIFGKKVFMKSVDTTKNILAPSKKNPGVKRWQKVESGKLKVASGKVEDKTQVTSDKKQGEEKIRLKDVTKWHEYTKGRMIETIRKNAVEGLNKEIDKHQAEIKSYVYVPDPYDFRDTENPIEISFSGKEKTGQPIIIRNGFEYKFAYQSNKYDRYDRSLTDKEMQEKTDKKKKDIQWLIDYNKKKIDDINNGLIDNKLFDEEQKRIAKEKDDREIEIANKFYPSKSLSRSLRDITGKKLGLSLHDFHDAKGNSAYIITDKFKIRFSDHESRTEQDFYRLDEKDKPFRPVEYEPEDIDIIIYKDRRGDAVVTIDGNNYGIADYNIDSIEDLSEFILEKINKKVVDSVEPTTTNESKPQSLKTEPNAKSGADDLGSDKRAEAQTKSSEEKGEKQIPQTETENFKKWFGESKVVDSEGKPLVVYHGSKTQFEVFDKVNGESSSSGRFEGFHFGTLDQAKMRNGKMVMALFLKAEKLQRSKDEGGRWWKKIQSAKSRNYDGIIYLNRYEGIPLEEYDEAEKRGVKTDADSLDRMSDEQFRKNFPSAKDSYIVFSPTQIKSAIDNDGSFDPENADITKGTKITRRIIFKKKKKDETFLL